ncbi:unnamed protein product [Rotaria sp. Silwood1]|nr:unnamed protein product [Rotaria sp. Silwood1]CAF1347439.1 unnamed protein product [Rotaria sp. Silwood1]CAF1349018.1 unnamed protein product [Rotaria sp. Silwood1]CAF3511231.1 unnamed protein product [Rotaria sp. Silwood1]CAF3562053.1 unnamed protein product [Rotaria sp. Silwood1]
MTTVSYSSHTSASTMKDIQHLFKKQAKSIFPPFQSYPTGLQYFNMRVTQRLHRYRSMKRKWQEVSTSVQNISALSTTCDSPISLPDIIAITQDIVKSSTIPTQKLVSELKPYCINDYINEITIAKDNNNKNSIDLDPLNSRIQQDLIKLRKLIKVKQGRFIDKGSLKMRTTSRSLRESVLIRTAFEDQENTNITNIRRPFSLNKLKPLDHVKIFGSQLQHSTLPKGDSTDSGIGSTSNSSSTCSQYSKQQQQQKKFKPKNNDKIFNIHRSRLNPPPLPLLPSNSLTYRASQLSMKTSRTTFKTTSNMLSKQSLSSHLQIPITEVSTVVTKSQSDSIEEECPSPVNQHLSDSEEIAARSYTYAAPTSSITPHSTMLKRKASLLPILLQSSSCIGMQTRQVRPKKNEYDLEEEPEENDEEEEEEEEEDDSYYYLLDYKHLLNCLPKPVVSIRSHHGQDDYRILFEQLEHIRETMPDSNIYNEYTRIT